MALDVGKLYTVKIRFTNAWSLTTAGRTYVVRVVTSLGNEFAIEAKLLPTP
jgi:hypothetical protein